MKIKECANFIFPNFQLYDFNNKEKSLNDYIKRMFTRSNKMFKYNDLPKNVKIDFVERVLQMKGHIGVIKHNDEIWFLPGEFGGDFDEFMFPTQYIIVNPALNISKTYTIGVDCIVIFNDTNLQGLSDLYRRYATLLVENDISLRMVDINSRMTNVLSAADERTQRSAQAYLDGIVEGKLGVITEPNFFNEEEGLNTSQMNQKSSGEIINLIEFQQYLKGSLWMEIGIKAPFNMKREALGDSENGLQDASLLPLVDNMLLCRQEAVEKINELFGTSISVELDGAWEDIELEPEHQLEDEDIEEQEDEIVNEENEEVNNEEIDDVKEMEGEDNDEQEQKED